MIKNSAKITASIGGLVIIISAIMGIIYIMTGDQTIVGSKFAGHRISHPKSEMPEMLAFAAMAISFLGLSIAAISLVMVSKGMTKVEQSKAQKSFTAFIVGVMIVLISAIVLAVISPKQSATYEDLHGMTIFWFVVVALLTGAITTLVGTIKILTKKAPIIYDEPQAPQHDEF